MPITQNRMLAIIQAADAFRAKVLEADQFLADILRELPTDPTLDECLKILQSIQLYRHHLNLPVKHLDNLAAERAHFAANATRNIRHANRAKRKRGAEIAPTRSTAPDAIGKAPQPFAHLVKQFPELASPEPQRFGVATPLPLHNERLIRQKIKLNELYKSKKMKEPYPDVYNDDEPLEPDHLRALGLPIPEADDGPF